ncbi:MAG: lamin tail domain-containing protein [Bacteroidales bacterium]|nr:lamin tail domain-containing protein [Bacteroidales bacterium]
MSTRKILFGIFALAIVVSGVVAACFAANSTPGIAARPEGPCDIYAAGGAPCVAAHSTTRALYASYDGPLYQVMRQSDGKTLDIGVVPPSGSDPGGYADAAAQDEFCRNTTCWVTVLYDQSGKENHLYQAPRGAFIGAALGGFDTMPIADMAPVTLMGHKVYGIFIVPGMGLRQNDPHGTAVDDQAEGQYWVINGHHFNSGCCFDYGNAETDSRDDGDGTMETTYYGNQPLWYHGDAPGPWIMTDQENNLVGCVNPDPNDKYCEGLPSITWRFVTATADGEPHHWRSMGGNAQEGSLVTMFDGPRIKNPRNSYDPMRKQGAILLGNGGDNNNYSSGTFYEGAMTAPGTFPTEETNQAIQANVVAAGYDVQRLWIGASDKTAAPNNLQTFSPRTTESTTVIFTNTTRETIRDLALAIDAPRGWKVNVEGSRDKDRLIPYEVLPGQTVVATFRVRSGRKAFNGDLTAVAQWTSAEGSRIRETAVEKVRNVPAVRINEFRVSDGSNKTNAFIELYNASDRAVNISGWELIQHAATLPYFSTIKIDRGVRLAPKSFYLLGLSTSGLAVDAAKGDKTLYVRDLTGMKEGDEIFVGKERHRIARLVHHEAPAGTANAFFGRNANAPGTPTTLWQPLPDGPVITVKAGSENVPVATTTGFKEGCKMAIGYGATYPAPSAKLEKYEVVTVTAVGKPGTQAYLAYDAKPGETNIKVSSVENISVGDVIRLDIDSEGHGIETVKVKGVGTASSVSPGRGPMSLAEAGTGLELEEPLKFAHSANMPFSCNGTGISFTPATRFDHSSNEPVLALIYEIELEEPLRSDHPVDEVICDPQVTTAGYQGELAADQLFGGPALGRMGNMALYDASGNVVDCLNWGTVVDPMLAEGYQAQSGLEEYGNYIHLRVEENRGGRRGAEPAPVMPNLSAGRYPDGSDTDDNIADFRFQLSSNLHEGAAAGTQKIVIADTRGIRIGHRFRIGGEKGEDVQVALIGEPRVLVSTVTMGTWTREVRTPVLDLTLAAPLKSDYAAGAPFVDNVPTPGSPNKF